MVRNVVKFLYSEKFASKSRRGQTGTRFAKPEVVTKLREAAPCCFTNKKWMF